ncbi:MAG: hypothetical protein JHD18_01735 [Rhodoferax sp.]|nr:hypothetical protein [Rhodoferax sp.]
MQWLFRAFLLLLGLGFMLVLLCMAALMFVFSLLRWLFTGRKPQVVLIMDSYKRWQQKAPWQARQSDSADIIDVQGRDLEPRPTRLPPTDKKD